MKFDLATATTDGTKAAGGFDGNGNSLPAEMLPSELKFNDIKFELGAAKTGSANAVVAKGQEIKLPAGQFNRVYLLAAAADGDQTGVFEAGGAKTELKIQGWGGFVGQWDDRQWSKADYKNDSYGQMTGLKPGFIKRADLAWYCSHHHDAEGKNVDYSYSYLFAYEMDLPAGAKTLKLPNNKNIRIMAVSVAQEGPKVMAARPLYDVLPVGTK